MQPRSFVGDEARRVMCAWLHERQCTTYNKRKGLIMLAQMSAIPPCTPFLQLADLGTPPGSPNERDTPTLRRRMRRRTGSATLTRTHTYVRLCGLLGCCVHDVCLWSWVCRNEPCCVGLSWCCVVLYCCVYVCVFLEVMVLLLCGV